MLPDRFSFFARLGRAAHKRRTMSSCLPVRLPSRAAVTGALCRCDGAHCDQIEPLGTIPDDVFVLYTTSLHDDTERLSRSTGRFRSPQLKRSADTFSLSINASARFQTITGFGGAFTDAAALGFKALTPAARAKLMESYFSEAGLRYSVGRIPIASSDFSTSVYSYNDVQWVDGSSKIEDLNLTHFSVEMDEASSKLPMIRAASAISPSGIRFFGSCWAPPVWMTQKNSSLNARLRDQPGGPIHKAYARYLSRFVREYAAKGVKIWALTGGNEPAGNTGKWQDLEFSAEDQRDFIKTDLGPALEGSGDTVLADEAAAKYVDGIGVHWYTAVEDTLDMFPRLLETHSKHPNVFIMGTEACEGYLPWSQGVYAGDWWRAERYAHDILGDINNFAVGWTDWNLCLDMSGGPNWAGNECDSPILIDTPNSVTAAPGSVDAFYKQPMYYYLGHIAAFVAPGSVRIGLETHTPWFSRALEASAFLSSDGKRIVAVVLNRATSGREFSLRCASGTGPSIDASIPPSAMQTYVFDMPPDGC